MIITKNLERRRWWLVPRFPGVWTFIGNPGAFLTSVGWTHGPHDHVGCGFIDPEKHDRQGEGNIGNTRRSNVNDLRSRALRYPRRKHA